MAKIKLGEIMKKLLLSGLLLSTFNLSAATKTVSFTYEYDIDYKKITADVICVSSFDANENGDGDLMESEVLWFAPKDYSKTKELIDAGYKAELNGNKGEQCDSLWTPGSGKTPHVSVYTYAYISKSDVEQAMKREGKSFVTRQIVFKKTTMDREILNETISTAHDDIMWEIWNEKK